MDVQELFFEKKIWKEEKTTKKWKLNNLKEICSRMKGWQFLIGPINIKKKWNLIIKKSIKTKLTINLFS